MYLAIFLSVGDQRVKSIPFATRRPTLHQVKLVHQTLSTLYCGLSLPPVTTGTKNTGTNNTGTKITGTKNAHVKETHIGHSKCIAESSEISNEVVTNEEVIVDGEDEEMDQNGHSLLKTKKKRRRKKVEKKLELVDPLVERLHALCHGNDVESLVTLLRDNNVQLIQPITDISSTTDRSTDTQSTGDSLLDINATISESTCLHVASSLGLIDILTVLMEYGADPTIKYVNCSPSLRHTEILMHY